MMRRSTGPRHVLTIAVLMVAAPLCGAENCSMPTEAGKMLRNQIAWEMTWLGRDYLTEPVLRFKVVTRPDRTLFYLTSKEQLFDYFPDETGSQMSSTACRNTEWLRCIEDVLQWSGPTKAGAALLGLPSRTRESIAADPTCDYEVPKSTVKSWSPSPDSVLKRRIVALVSDEISQEAKPWGDAKRAVCNDFNVADPMLWAVVEFAENRRELLVAVEFNAANLFCNASRFEVVADTHRSLLDKIHKDTLELSAAATPVELP